jgi:hypothetical protein
MFDFSSKNPFTEFIIYYYHKLLSSGSELLPKTLAFSCGIGYNIICQAGVAQW